MKAFTVSFLFLLCTQAHAQPLRSLKTVPVPKPAGLENYVRDNSALIALGKALFWDMQAGSDGVTACASCHFHAGADHRAQNQLTDPLRPFPPNLVLDMVYFPFRWLSNPEDRGSTVLRDLSMRVGSMGLYRRKFLGIEPGQAAELGEELQDRPEFTVNGLHLRRVTQRNSPSVINSVFFVSQFWDGRANRVFNGFTPSGNTIDAPGAWATTSAGLERRPVRLDPASLASQAVGPIMDHLEMSYEGRTWPQLARKLFSLRPLALQTVAAGDSVLGALVHSSGRGLREGYLDLVQRAFLPAYWEWPQTLDGGFTQAESNFSLFWGLALHAYQSTLVSGDSPFDRFQEGDTSALTPDQQEGMRFFQTTGRCTTCHGGPEFSAASFTAGAGRNNRAFTRTGVRPVEEDPGLANGNFKSSGLRNIELTGPYFHNGGQATLEQVIAFYERGGDFGANNGAIRSFRATPAQRAALVAFLKSLTDDRVRYDRAPFDHPELCVPTGHIETAIAVAPYPNSARERWAAIPAAGAQGHLSPLGTFEDLINGSNASGRAHSMMEACTAPLP
ncbi:MAG: hypothetical protein JNK48_24495 [Bryobacterales bacterium]|nr:hypothetical protein [Bryobacterales bacterium]